MKTPIKRMIVAIIICLNVVSVPCVGHAISGKEAEEYDRKLSEFIVEVVENLRGQMPEGIPEIGVPPLDPLTIANVNEKIDDSLARLTLRMRDVKIVGLSLFRIRSLKADLERGFVKFSITVPELRSNGYCYMDGKLISIFPLRGDGPFQIHVTEVSLDGYGHLTVTTNGDTKVHMNDLKLNLNFGKMDLDFKSLLGGGRWTEILMKMLSGVAPKVFQLFHEEAMAKINKALLDLINKELDKGTLKDLLDMIPGP